MDVLVVWTRSPSGWCLNDGSIARSWFKSTNELQGAQNIFWWTTAGFEIVECWSLPPITRSLCGWIQAAMAAGRRKSNRSSSKISELHGNCAWVSNFSWRRDSKQWRGKNKPTWLRCEQDSNNLLWLREHSDMTKDWLQHHRTALVTTWLCRSAVFHLRPTQAIKSFWHNIDARVELGESLCRQHLCTLLQRHLKSFEWRSTVLEPL
jgi:hypothetical protein